MRQHASAAVVLMTALSGIAASGVHAQVGMGAGSTAQGAGSAARESATPEPTRVTVDWRKVADADIQRCGLTRLRAGTIERLVNDGYAVADAVDQRGIRVAVASAGEGVQLRVESTGIVREDTLRAGADCDATFVLDVISRIAMLVEEVARARPASPEPPPQPPPRDAEPASQTRSEWQAAIDADARANDALGWQLGGGIAVRRRGQDGWEAGARAELTGNARLGVTVLEPALYLTGAWQPSLPGAGLYFEVGPVLHLGSSDVRHVVELDAALGSGLQLSLGHFWAQLGAYVRLRSFEHRVGTKTAFDTGRVGLVLRIGAQLSGS